MPARGLQRRLAAPAARRLHAARAPTSNASTASAAGSNAPPPPEEVTAAVAVTVALFEAEPPGPVQLSVYVVVAATETARLPEPVAWLPVNRPAAAGTGGSAGRGPGQGPSGTLRLAGLN